MMFEWWIQDSPVKGLRLVKFRVHGDIRVWIEDDGRESHKYHINHLTSSGWEMMEVDPG